MKFLITKYTTGHTILWLNKKTNKIKRQICGKLSLNLSDNCKQYIKNKYKI